MMRWGIRIALSLSLLATRSLAGIPLELDVNQLPVRHVMPVVSNPVFGARDSASGAFLRDLAIEAGTIWKAVPTASLDFRIGRSVLLQDIFDFTDYLGVCGDRLSPLVPDEFGYVIDALLGMGASEVVLGLTLFDCDPAVGLIEEHTIIFNSSTLSDNAERRHLQGLWIVAHEFGHVLNLGHTLLNAGFANDGDGLNDRHLPLMTPIISDDAAVGVPGLHLDDVSMVSLLYPAPGFLAATATIAGTTLLGEGGRPHNGTFVVVRSTTSPLDQAVWGASGLLPTGVGLLGPVGDLSDPNRPAGVFQASGLPPGEYTVEVEGGLSGERAETYSGDGESNDPLVDTGDTVPIVVGPGEVRADVVIRLDDDLLASSSLAYDTSWDVRWKVSGAIGGERVPVGGVELPPGRLDLLPTGGLLFSGGDPMFDVLLSGQWEVASRGSHLSRKSFVHDADGAPELLDLFQTGSSGIDFHRVGGKGRVARRGSGVVGTVAVKGSTVRGRLPVRVSFKYKGLRRGRDDVAPGPVPAIPLLAVLLDPNHARVEGGETIAIAATIEGGASGVTWELRGPGTLEAVGPYTALYTAPAATASTQMARISARSIEDPRVLTVASIDVGPVPINIDGVWRTTFEVLGVPETCDLTMVDERDSVTLGGFCGSYGALSLGGYFDVESRTLTLAGTLGLTCHDLSVTAVVSATGTSMSGTYDCDGFATGGVSGVKL